MATTIHWMHADKEHDVATGWRPFTVPNAVTLVRLACIPWFVWLLLSVGDRLGAAILLAVLGATDWVDGWFARRFDQVSELGKILDPTADRLLMFTALVATLVDGSIPLWFALAALIREVLVSLAAVALGALGVRRIDVTWWGKTGTFFLMFAAPLLLAGVSSVAGADVLRLMGWVCGILGLAIGWYAAWGYVPIALEAFQDRPDSKS